MGIDSFRMRYLLSLGFVGFSVLLWTALGIPGNDMPAHRITSEFDILSNECKSGCNFINHITQMNCHYNGNGFADCISHTPPPIRVIFESVNCKKYDATQFRPFCHYIYSLESIPEQTELYIQKTTVAVTINEKYVPWLEYIVVCLFAIPIVASLLNMMVRIANK